MERKGRLTVLLLFLVCCFISPAICVIKCISFTQNCEGFLKQAADASNPEIALERIDKAISYIEAKNLTSGYTSIVIKTEDDALIIGCANTVIPQSVKNIREKAFINCTGLKAINIPRVSHRWRRKRNCINYSRWDFSAPA